jgi:adenylate kinase family enzyme
MLIQNNNIYNIGSFTNTHDKLPMGIYRLRQNPRTFEFYLIKVEDFKIPSKLYGDLSSADRILNTYKNSDKNLAALFLGSQGSGKTIEAKLICSKANVPTIIIDEYFDDSNIINFLSSPELEGCIIFIDEYEKLYSNSQEETIMLQLLDGACNAKHLFLLTANSTNRMSGHLLNRPSRIFYRKSYTGIESDVLEEILDNELINQKWRDELNEVFNKFTELTFDIVMSLLREVNLYDESPIKCAKMMNFVPQPVYVEITQIFNDGSIVSGDPMTLDFADNDFDIKIYKNANIDSGYKWKSISVKDVTRVNKNTWEIKDSNCRIVFTKSSLINQLF